MVEWGEREVGGKRIVGVGSRSCWGSWDGRGVKMRGEEGCRDEGIGGVGKTVRARWVKGEGRTGLGESRSTWGDRGGGRWGGRSAKKVWAESLYPGEDG